MLPHSLIAYDADGNVVATLDSLVLRDVEGHVLGLVDFAEQERTGKLRAVWEVEGAAGSGTWPEWLGQAAHAFRVTRGEDGRLTALVHRESGHIRKRSHVEQAIQRRIAETADGEPADIRDIVGGPDRPLILEDDGKTHPHSRGREQQRVPLPLIGADEVP